MSTTLNTSNLNTAENEGKEGTDQFNCWGGTLYALGQIDELYWVNACDMTDFLEECTVLVDEDIREGDILTLWSEYDGLVHTAVCVRDGVWWHKMGTDKSEYTDMQGVLDSYCWDSCEIRRLF